MPKPRITEAPPPSSSRVRVLTTDPGPVSRAMRRRAAFTAFWSGHLFHYGPLIIIAALVSRAALLLPLLPLLVLQLMQLLLLRLRPLVTSLRCWCCCRRCCAQPRACSATVQVEPRVRASLRDVGDSRALWKGTGCNRGTRRLLRVRGVGTQPRRARWCSLLRARLRRRGRI